MKDGDKFVTRTGATITCDQCGATGVYSEARNRGECPCCRDGLNDSCSHFEQRLNEAGNMQGFPVED